MTNGDRSIEQTSATPPAFIVAEISKTWINGYEEAPGLLCERFERVIEVNRLRGYRLHSFNLHQRHIPRSGNTSVDSAERFVETIIAVFEAVDASVRPPTR